MSSGGVGAARRREREGEESARRGVIPFWAVGPVIHKHPSFGPPQDRPLQGPSLKMMANHQTQSRKHGEPPKHNRAYEPTNHPNTIRQTWRTAKHNEASLANHPNHPNTIAPTSQRTTQKQSSRHGEPPNAMRQAWRTTQTQSSTAPLFPNLILR